MTAPACVTAYIALGSNLGDREALLAFAVEALSATAQVEVTAVSRVYETEPVGPGPQGPYLNAAVGVETGLEPRALLVRMLAIEREAGRERPVERQRPVKHSRPVESLRPVKRPPPEDSAEAPLRWGPRTLDLDLLLYGDRCIDEPGLCVPHPRLHERAFVLEPLCELAGELVHPRLGEPLSAFAARVRDPAGVRLHRRALSWAPKGRPRASR